MNVKGEIFMIYQLKNLENDEVKTIRDAIDVDVLMDPDTGYDLHLVIFREKSFLVFNCKCWVLVDDGNLEAPDYPIDREIARKVRHFIYDNGYLNTFPYTCECYLYKELDNDTTQIKECLYNVEAENKKDCLSCKFEKSEIICIIYEKGREAQSSGFCAVELKCGLYLRFDLDTWTIFQSSDDGYLYINGVCVQEPLTQEERGIGMIDVMNGDGYYDENGDFYSYHHYED